MQRTGNVRRVWYLLVLVPAAFAVVSAAYGTMGLFEAIEEMPRVAVPGSGDVVLDVGDYTLFVENASPLPADTAVRPVELRCGLRSLWDGAQVALARPTSDVHYQIGGYSGRSMFTASIPAYGTYHLRCEGTGGTASVAFGQGLGRRLVDVLLCLLGGGLAATVVFLVVWGLRSRGRVLAAAHDAESPTLPVG